MLDYTSHIGVLILSVHMPAAQSLKDKRMILKSFKDRVRAKYNVSIAELDTEDKWQLAILGITSIGNDQRYLDGCLQDILSFTENFNGLQISDYEISFT